MSLPINSISDHLSCEISSDAEQIPVNHLGETKRNCLETVRIIESGCSAYATILAFSRDVLHFAAKILSRLMTVLQSAIPRLALLKPLETHSLWHDIKSESTLNVLIRSKTKPFMRTNTSGCHIRLKH
jgi:hypothetical protein